MMTSEQFEEHLDLFGANLARWPKDAANRARALLETSETAQLLLEDALFLDDALNAYEVAEPNAALEARLLDLAPPIPAAQTAHKSGLLSWMKFRTIAVAATSLACGVVGFTVSAQTINTIQTNAEAEAFLTASASTSTVSSDFWSGVEG